MSNNTLNRGVHLNFMQRVTMLSKPVLASILSVFTIFTISACNQDKLTAAEQSVKERPATASAHKPFTYTQGQLSIYSTTKSMSGMNPTRLTELLTTQKDSKITIASPELAPYGASAKAYLQAKNIYDALNSQKRIIQAENIGQAFQYAHTGNVDYGFVAQSQVTAIKATPEQFYILPADTYPAILQDGIVLSNAVTATGFTDYLRSAAGQAYFAKAGYLAVEP